MITLPPETLEDILTQLSSDEARRVLIERTRNKISWPKKRIDELAEYYIKEFEESCNRFKRWKDEDSFYRAQDQYLSPLLKLTEQYPEYKKQTIELLLNPEMNECTFKGVGFARSGSGYIIAAMYFPEEIKKFSHGSIIFDRCCDFYLKISNDPLVLETALKYADLAESTGKAKVILQKIKQEYLKDYCMLAIIEQELSHRTSGIISRYHLLQSQRFYRKAYADLLKKATGFERYEHCIIAGYILEKQMKRPDKAKELYRRGIDYFEEGVTKHNILKLMDWDLKTSRVIYQEMQIELGEIDYSKERLTYRYLGDSSVSLRYANFKLGGYKLQKIEAHIKELEERIREAGLQAEICKKRKSVFDNNIYLERDIKCNYAEMARIAEEYQLPEQAQLYRQIQALLDCKQ